MRFYNQPHRFYAGVDLHARAMYVCVLDHQGKVRLHQNLNADADTFLAAIAQFRDGLVVGCECMFAWYWLADRCAASVAPWLGHQERSSSVPKGTERMIPDRRPRSILGAPHGLCSTHKDRGDTDPLEYNPA